MATRSSFRIGNATRIGSSEQRLCETRGLLRVPQESQPFLVGMAIDQKQISCVHLIGRYQSCQWIYNVTLDCPFQMPGSVFQIRSFAQQKLPPLGTHVEPESSRGQIHP